jgi:hypothetical protein
MANSTAKGRKRAKRVLLAPETPEDAAAARQRARDRAGEEALPRKSGRTKGDGGAR